MQGGLGRVDDEVAQGEAEALGGALQQHGLRPRPELLVRRGRGGGRAGRAAPPWGLILPEEARLATCGRARGLRRARLAPPAPSRGFMCHVMLRLLTKTRWDATIQELFIEIAEAASLLLANPHFSTGAEHIRIVNRVCLPASESTPAPYLRLIQEDSSYVPAPSQLLWNTLFSHFQLKKVFFPLSSHLK